MYVRERESEGGRGSERASEIETGNSFICVQNRDIVVVFHRRLSSRICNSAAKSAIDLTLRRVMTHYSICDTLFNDTCIEYNDCLVCVCVCLCLCVSRKSRGSLMT